MAANKLFNLRLSHEDWVAIRIEAARQRKSESKLAREWLEPFLQMIRQRQAQAAMDEAA
jgi:predicted HicB family RNase H-like nuclease